MHCSQGEIAKVTLTNTVLEFPGPISISCEYGLEACQELLVTYEVKHAYSYPWFPLVDFTNTITVFAPFIDIILRYTPRYFADGNGYAQIIVISGGVQGQNFCTLPFTESEVGALQATPNPYASVTVLSVVTKQTGVTANKKLVIRDANGVELYSQLGDCYYQVECKAPCPEGTLDCGDCCLDCNSIFNSISAIRRILRTLG